MAQSLEQINQALKKLEQQAIDLGQKLHSAHQGYRNVLAQTAMEQTIMSCFTLCTEAYPQEFLKLSVGDRHKLQTQIKAIAQQMQQDLREVPSPDTPSSELVPPTPEFSLPAMLALPRASQPVSDTDMLILDEPDDDDLDEDDGLDAIDFDPDFDDDDEDEDTDRHERDRRDPSRDRSDDRNRQIEAELKALFSLESLLNRPPQLPDNPVEQVGFWHRYVEDQVTQCLRKVSSEINQTLQTQKVLPAQIPAPILEAAALADGGETFGKTPHLMRMVLEAREKSRDDDRSDKSSRRRSRENSRPAAVVNLVTLQLRLSDLEFYDTNLISWRNQIRTLLKDLKGITKEYKRQQQQQSIANAKMAWRSTWSNE